MSDDLEARLRAHAEKYADTPEDAARLVETTLARLRWRRRRGHKVCSRCKEAKPPEAFGRDASRSDGLAHRCLACDRIRKRALPHTQADY